jgi:primosomal protein N' (replication factor Y)
MEYPPFTDLILVEFTSENETQAFETAEKCKDYLLRCSIEENGEHIFSPKVSYHFKGKESFRYYIMIKCPKGLRNKYIYYINAFGSNLVKRKSSCNMTIDVNPYSTI